MLRIHWSAPATVALLALPIVMAAPSARADTVTMKNGLVYRGTVDRDNTIVWIDDGLKRVVIRDSKIDRIVPDDASRGNQEQFQLMQPMEKHAGAMPKEVLAVDAEPWNERGRRAFRYVTGRPGKLYR